MSIYKFSGVATYGPTRAGVLVNCLGALLPIQVPVWVESRYALECSARARIIIDIENHDCHAWAAARACSWSAGIRDPDPSDSYT